MPDPAQAVDVPALLARVAALEEEASKRASLGRRPRAPRTADARLVARVCAALNLSRAALAKRIGYAETGGALSRPLTEKAREALRAMLPEAGEVGGKKSDG